VNLISDIYFYLPQLRVHTLITRLLAQGQAAVCLTLSTHQNWTLCQDQ